ncbi:DnaJ subfamily A member 2, partial [Galemys pyrenaicus]
MTAMENKFFRKVVEGVVTKLTFSLTLFNGAVFTSMMYNGKTIKLQLIKTGLCSACSAKVESLELFKKAVLVRGEMQSVCSDCNGEATREKDHCKKWKGKKGSEVEAENIVLLLQEKAHEVFQRDLNAFFVQELHNAMTPLKKVIYTQFDVQFPTNNWMKPDKSSKLTDLVPGGDQKDETYHDSSDEENSSQHGLTCPAEELH